MRVVIDTNAWISRLLIADSVSAQAVDMAMEQAEVVVSESTLGELADLLSRDKWDRYVTIEDRQEFMQRLMQITILRPVISQIDDCRDPRDNKFLALAFDSEAEFIITGDKDLLVLHPWRGIQIIKPSDFLALQN